MSLSCGYTLKVQDPLTAMVTIVFEGTPILTLGSSPAGLAAYRRQFGSEPIFESVDLVAETLANGAIRVPGSLIWSPTPTQRFTLQAGEILVSPATLVADQDIYLSPPLGVSP